MLTPLDAAVVVVLALVGALLYFKTQQAPMDEAPRWVCLTCRVWASENSSRRGVPICRSCRRPMRGVPRR